jgi:3-oxoacyl-[acyl-carrier-protein] synthase II
MALTASNYVAPEGGEGDPNLGLVVGTVFGGVHSIASFDWTGITEGPSWVSPMEFANTVINAPAGQAAIKQKLRGVNSTVCSGFASGLYAISYAADFLRFGRAKHLLAGGMEEVCEETSLGFVKLGLSAPGEGAAIWMLETEETALGRGAAPMFEVMGFGAVHDAHGKIGYNPRGEGAASAIRMAIANSELTPADIGAVITSANGIEAGDVMESRALKAVFGDSIMGMPSFAPKTIFGEAMGAGGAIGAMTAGFALRRGELPGGTALRSTNILINAFSCDGNNASLVIRPWKK